MKPVKIIQIGVGHDHAPATFDSLKRHSECFELVGWVPVPGEEEQAEKLRVSSVYSDVPCLALEDALAIPGLEAAAIETVDRDLTQYALAAAEKGLAVHMDKPGGVSQDDFTRLCSVIRGGSNVLQLGYMYRYNKDINAAIAKAKSGELGTVYSVECHMDCEHPASKRQWLADYPGGMMHFLGCHLIDLIVQVMGIPDEVIPYNQPIGTDGVTGDDFGFALLKYPSGVSFAHTTAVEPGGFMRRQMVICGTKGTIELRPLEEYTSAGQVTRGRICTAGNGWGTDGTRFTGEPTHRYDPMMLDFAAMVRGESVNPFTLDYELALHEVLLRACGV